MSKVEVTWGRGSWRVRANQGLPSVGRVTGLTAPVVMQNRGTPRISDPLQVRSDWNHRLSWNLKGTLSYAFTDWFSLVILLTVVKRQSVTSQWNGFRALVFRLQSVSTSVAPNPERGRLVTSGCAGFAARSYHTFIHTIRQHALQTDLSVSVECRLYCLL